MQRSGNPQEWGRQRSLLGRSAVRSMVLGASAGRIPVLHVRPGRMIASEEESEVATDEPSLGAQGAADGGRRAGCMSIASDRVPTGSPELTVSSDLQVLPASKAAVALERAVEYLRDTQAEAGWWKGELETNVTMDAEDLLLREFLGIRTAEETEQAARVDPLPAARGRHLGELLRRSRRSVHHDRILGRAAACGRSRRRAAPGEGRRVDPGAGRRRVLPRLHPYLAGAVRALVVGRAAQPSA